jgi:hypothetical protein
VSRLSTLGLDWIGPTRKGPSDRTLVFLGQTGCLVDGQIEGTSMIDCGATSQFMDKDFALKHGLKLRQKPIPETLTVVDGRTSVAGDLTHEVTVQLLIDQHLENVVFQITKLGGVPLILGKTSLRRHNPLIDWVPPHKLRLKVGAPIILLRNINPKNGLCNGTRLQVTHLARNVVGGTSLFRWLFFIDLHVANCVQLLF